MGGYGRKWMQQAFSDNLLGGFVGRRCKVIKVLDVALSHNKRMWPDGNGDFTVYFTRRNMTTIQQGCERCGKCCKQGGPALHRDDLHLVRSGKIPITSLITIRKGELAHNPLTGAVQPVAMELVKIKGTGRRWDCLYYDGSKGCTIYGHRPLACRTLKCWDTDEILALIEKNTLSRMDILAEDHFLLTAIKEHDRLFPCDELQQIQSRRWEISIELRDELEKRANEEMRFRMQRVAEFQLQLSEELFYFGRPFFQLLQALGVRISEGPSGIRLHWEG